MGSNEKEVIDFFNEKIGKHEDLKQFTAKKVVIAALDWGSTPFYALVKNNADEEGISLHDEWLKLYARIKAYVDTRGEEDIPACNVGDTSGSVQ